MQYKLHLSLDGVKQLQQHNSCFSSGLMELRFPLETNSKQVEISLKILREYQFEAFLHNSVQFAAAKRCKFLTQLSQMAMSWACFWETINSQNLTRVLVVLH